MQEIINILMRRDGIDETVAKEILDECATEVNDAINRGALFDAENAIEDYLGLEPDYLEYFLFGY